MSSFHSARGARALLIALCIPATIGSATAAELADTLTRPAAIVARPEQSVLLGIATAGDRLVVVGERGLVALSDDHAKHWRQVPVPLSVSLTAVTFSTPTSGWAVGHRGVILGSVDGGEHWSLQLEGRQFAERALMRALLALAAAGGATEQATRDVKDAEALVRDGADKPFLDVSFADEHHGLAVGAYGLCAQTDNGGVSWEPCMSRLPNPKGAHMYAIARSGSTILIAGEQGLLLRSDDAGAHYAAVPGPFTTSLFCAAVNRSGDTVLAGLRGSAFFSAGGSFGSLQTDSQGSCAGSAPLNDGRLVFVNQLGQLLTHDARAHRLVLVPTPPMAPLSGVVQDRSGALVLVGARGVTSLPASMLTTTRSARP